MGKGHVRAMAVEHRPDVLQPMRPGESHFQDILYEKHEGVARITLNRPQVYNAYATGTLEELTRAVGDAALDDAVGVIVLTGAGSSAFCTGGDVHEYAERYTQRPRDYWKYMGLFEGAVESLLRCGKPTIARLNGITVGGGNELHLACDLSVAASHVYLGQVGVGVGSVACGGATQWLPLAVGDRRARAMLMLNERVPAQRALEWGLVNEVAPSVRTGREFVEDAHRRGGRPRAQGIAGLPDRPRRAGRRRGPAERSFARDVPRMPPLHEAAGQLLEGALLAQHRRSRARVALAALLQSRAPRRDERLRREASPRHRGPSPAPRRGQGRRIPLRTAVAELPEMRGPRSARRIRVLWSVRESPPSSAPTGGVGRCRSAAAAPVPPGGASPAFLRDARDLQRKLVEEYYAGLQPTDGKRRPVAYMLVGGNLTEIVRSFGYDVVFPEIVALNCAIKHQSLDNILHAESLGYGLDVCGYVKNDLGLQDLGRPDLLRQDPPPRPSRLQLFRLLCVCEVVGGARRVVRRAALHVRRPVHAGRDPAERGHRLPGQPALGAGPFPRKDHRPNVRHGRPQARPRRLSPGRGRVGGVPSRGPAASVSHRGLLRGDLLHVPDQRAAALPRPPTSTAS